MAKRAYVTVKLETLEDRVGLWCDDCLLPSRCESDLVLTYNDTADSMKTFWVCAECGRRGWR